ncbi:hypothetical protein JCM5353_001140 [Sporobolomyces roseus]
MDGAISRTNAAYVIYDPVPVPVNPFPLPKLQAPKPFDSHKPQITTMTSDPRLRFADNFLTRRFAPVDEPVENFYQVGLTRGPDDIWNPSTSIQRATYNMHIAFVAAVSPEVDAAVRVSHRLLRDLINYPIMVLVYPSRTKLDFEHLFKQTSTQITHFGQRKPCPAPEKLTERIAWLSAQADNNVTDERYTVDNPSTRLEPTLMRRATALSTHFGRLRKKLQKSEFIVETLLLSPISVVDSLLTTLGHLFPELLAELPSAPPSTPKTAAVLSLLATDKSRRTEYLLSLLHPYLEMNLSSWGPRPARFSQDRPPSLRFDLIAHLRYLISQPNLSGVTSAHNPEGVTLHDLEVAVDFLLGTLAFLAPSFVEIFDALAHSQPPDDSTAEGDLRRIGLLNRLFPAGTTLSQLFTYADPPSAKKDKAFFYSTLDSWTLLVLLILDAVDIPNHPNGVDFSTPTFYDAVDSTGNHDSKILQSLRDNLTYHNSLREKANSRLRSKDLPPPTLPSVVPPFDWQSINLPPRPLQSDPFLPLNVLYCQYQPILAKVKALVSKYGGIDKCQFLSPLERQVWYQSRHPLQIFPIGLCSSVYYEYDEQASQDYEVAQFTLNEDKVRHESRIAAAGIGSGFGTIDDSHTTKVKLMKRLYYEVGGRMFKNPTDWKRLLNGTYWMSLTSINVHLLRTDRLNALPAVDYPDHVEFVQGTLYAKSNYFDKHNLPIFTYQHVYTKTYDSTIQDPARRHLLRPRLPVLLPSLQDSGTTAVWTPWINPLPHALRRSLHTVGSTLIHKVPLIYQRDHRPRQLIFETPAAKEQHFLKEEYLWALFRDQMLSLPLANVRKCLITLDRGERWPIVLHFYWLSPQQQESFNIYVKNDQFTGTLKSNQRIRQILAKLGIPPFYIGFSARKLVQLPSSFALVSNRLECSQRIPKRNFRVSPFSLVSLTILQAPYLVCLISAFIAEYSQQSAANNIESRLDSNVFHALAYTESRQKDAASVRQSLARRILQEALPYEEGITIEVIFADGDPKAFTQATGSSGPRSAGPLTVAIQNELKALPYIKPHFWIVREDLTSRTCPACGDGHIYHPHDVDTGRTELRITVCSNPDCGYQGHRDGAAAECLAQVCVLGAITGHHCYSGIHEGEGFGRVNPPRDDGQELRPVKAEAESRGRAAEQLHVDNLSYLYPPPGLARPPAPTPHKRRRRRQRKVMVSDEEDTEEEEDFDDRPSVNHNPAGLPDYQQPYTRSWATPEAIASVEALKEAPPVVDRSDYTEPVVDQHLRDAGFTHYRPGRGFELLPGMSSSLD